MQNQGERCSPHIQSVYHVSGARVVCTYITMSTLYSCMKKVSDKELNDKTMDQGFKGKRVLTGK